MVLAAAGVNLSAAVLVSRLSGLDKHGKRLRYYWKPFAQQLLPCALIFPNGSGAGRSVPQQPGANVTDALWRRASRYCGLSGARCLANPSVAAGNLALACNGDS